MSDIGDPNRAMGVAVSEVTVRNTPYTLALTSSHFSVCPTHLLSSYSSPMQGLISIKRNKSSYLLFYSDSPGYNDK